MSGRLPAGEGDPMGAARQGDEGYRMRFGFILTARAGDGRQPWRGGFDLGSSAKTWQSFRWRVALTGDLGSARLVKPELAWPLVIAAAEEFHMLSSKDDKLLLKIRDVAHLLSLSPSTIRRRLANDAFPKPRKGRKGSPLLWAAEDIRRWAMKKEAR